MGTMDTFGGKGKAATLMASLDNITTFGTQEDENKCERIRRPSLDSFASASAQVSKASAASTSTVSTTNSLAVP
jgi:hypothetical protein